MRTAVGLVRPDMGQVSYGGVPLNRLGNLAGLAGASFDASTLPAAWSARTALQVVATVAGSPAGRVDEALALVGLADAAKRRTAKYSMGMRQRLALALALIAEPRVLILDEPTNSLDPVGCHQLRTWIRKHADRGNTVLVSSHNLPEVEMVADRVVFMQQSRVVRDQATSDLLAADAVLVRAERADLLQAELRQGGHDASQLDDGALRVTGITTTEIGRLAAAAGLVLSELSTERRRLSDVYQSVSTVSTEGISA
jgi:ABC-2 type transport system ATP-binding protein